MSMIVQSKYLLVDFNNDISYKYNCVKIRTDQYVNTYSNKIG